MNTIKDYFVKFLIRIERIVNVFCGIIVLNKYFVYSVFYLYVWGIIYIVEYIA